MILTGEGRLVIIESIESAVRIAHDESKYVKRSLADYIFHYTATKPPVIAQKRMPLGHCIVILIEKHNAWIGRIVYHCLILSNVSTSSGEMTQSVPYPY